MDDVEFGCPSFLYSGQKTFHYKKHLCHAIFLKGGGGGGGGGEPQCLVTL